jgi:exosortase/archaeosortase
MILLTVNAAQAVLKQVLYVVFLHLSPLNSTIITPTSSRMLKVMTMSTMALDGSGSVNIDASRA